MRLEDYVELDYEQTSQLDRRMALALERTCASSAIILVPEIESGHQKRGTLVYFMRFGEKPLYVTASQSPEAQRLIGAFLAEAAADGLNITQVKWDGQRAGWELVLSTFSLIEDAV